MNAGNLTLENVEVTSSIVTEPAAIFDRGGGGIYNRDGARLHLIDSTVSGNSTVGTPGGGIYSFFNTYTLIENSIVSGNVSGEIAGGLRSLSDVDIVGSTFTGNVSTAWHGGGIFHTDGVMNIALSSITGNFAPAATGHGLAVATFGAPATVNLYDTNINETDLAASIIGDPTVAVLNADAGTTLSSPSAIPNVVVGAPPENTVPGDPVLLLDDVAFSFA